MKINVSIDIPEVVAVRLLKNKGHKVLKHDFGTFRKAHHNRDEWNEDVRPGVLIDGTVYELDVAFVTLFSFELRDAILKKLNTMI